MRRILVPSLFLAVAACGGATAPAELRDARTAYNAASKGPASQQDPAALHTARLALDRAERSFANEGDSRTTRDLAYVAMRRAQLADASGRTVAALQQAQAAQIEAQTLERNRLAQQQTELERTKQSLTKTQEQLESERRARAEADRKAQQTMEDLKKIATVKQDTRGMVITLSGSVLFATNQSKLLPGAAQRLEEVANALTRGDPESKITIEGYTDSRGTREHNMALSEKRAETVKNQLVSRGVAADRITTVGKGPDEPVASNQTPEGRANNRRVEIIVAPRAPSPGQEGGGQTP